MNMHINRNTGTGLRYLLHILLKDAELKALVQTHFAVLTDVFQLSLVMQHLVDDIQDVVHRLGVIRRCRQ